MDELLKNCNTELFKVGDKVRIRQDKAKNVNYAIQHMIDFFGGDK